MEDVLAQCVQDARNSGSVATIGLLVVIDTSASLRSRDPGDRRVVETKNAIAALDELVQEANDTGLPSDTAQFDVRMRIDGFGAAYEEGTWTSLREKGGAEQLTSRAEDFRNKKTDTFTDYRAALSGAAEAIDELMEFECPLVFWFTDGEYDTDDLRRSGDATYLSRNEVSEIAGEQLCGDDGVVDQLRRNEVPIVGFGLQANKLFSTSLIESIITGSDYEVEYRESANAAAQRNAGRCGREEALGTFVTGDGDGLQRELVDRLREILFRSLTAGDALCQPGATKCSTEFFVGPQVEEFNLIFERPTRQGFRVILESPDCAFQVDNGVVVVDGSLPDQGLSVKSPSQSWRWVRAFREPFESGNSRCAWSGTWTVRFEGLEGVNDDGEALDPPEVKFLWDDVSVSHGEYRGSDPGTYSDVELRLAFGDRPALQDEPIASVGVTAEIELLGLNGESVDRETVDIKSDGIIRVPESWVENGRDLQVPWFELRVTPVAQPIVDETVDEIIEKRYETQTVRVINLDAVTVALEDEYEGFYYDVTKVDREGPVYAVTQGGQRLTSQVNDICASFEAKVGGTALEFDLSIGQEGTFELPSDLRDIVFDKNVPGGTVNVELVRLVVAKSCASTASGAPGIEVDPSLLPKTELVVPRSEGNGLPLVLDVTASPVFGQDDLTLTFTLVPPADGKGTLTLASSELTTTDGEVFTLASDPACLVADGTAQVKCGFTFTHEFDSPESVVVEIEYRLDGTKVPAGEGDRVETRSIEVEMSRPIDSDVLWKTLLGLAVLLIGVQLILRVIFTTVIARFNRTNDQLGQLTFEGLDLQDGTEAIRSIDPRRAAIALENATMLQGAGTGGRAINVGPVRLRVSWWGTFFNLREHEGGGADLPRSIAWIAHLPRSLTRRQAAMASARTENSDCISNRGAYIDRTDQVFRGIPALNPEWLWFLTASRAEGYDGKVEATLIVIIPLAAVRPSDPQYLESRLSDIFGQVDDVARMVWPDVKDARAKALSAAKGAGVDDPATVPGIGGKGGQDPIEVTSAESNDHWLRNWRDPDQSSGRSLETGPSDDDGLSGWLS